MEIVYKNDGTYTDFALSGTLLSFRGGDLTLDLAALERDYPVSVTVSEDYNGRLTTGASKRYVAEIDIPARQSVVEKTGVADNIGFPVLRRVYTRLSTDNIVLTLWAVREE